MTTNEFQTFLKQYPTYKQTESIDTLRKKDYARLDRGEHIYLDYTGGGIYAESQIEKHHKLSPLRLPRLKLLKARAITSSNFSMPTQMNISPSSLPMPAAR